jgi:hypothetical protein
MVLLGEAAQVVARLCPIGVVLIFTQDRCTVCTGHAIGSKIILDVLDGTPR